MTAFDRVRRAFEDHGLAVQTTGSATFTAQAPGHSAKDRSVSVRQIEGAVLVHSFSDETADVLAALGLQARDLFDDPKGVDYRYTDNIGRLVRTVHRSPDKGFRQQVVDNTAVPLYRLDEVLAGVTAGRRIWIPEGEKDVEVLRSLGEVATTSPQGAQSWAKADYTPLAHALEVVIVADDDQPGHDRATGLYEHLQGIVSGSVKVVLPAEGCKDITDHIMAGHSPEDLRTVSTHRPARRVALTRASDVVTKHQPFILADLWPEDVLTLIAGRAGEGKSTWTLHKVAQATRGELPGDYAGQVLNVAITATEDSKPLQRLRLEAAGADLEHVVFLDAMLNVAGEDVEAAPRIPDDLPQIRRELERAGIKIWIIDPITGLIDGDTNRRDDVRASLDPLAAVARDLHLAVVGVAHFSKGGGRASDKVSGSHAFRDVVRSLILVAQDDETGDRVLTLDKSNYSTAAGTSWAFRLENTEVPTADGTIEDIAHVIEIGETELSVGQIINRDPDSDDGDDRNEIEKFILEYITEAGGECLASEIEQVASRAGYTNQALRKARMRMKDPKITSKRTGFGKGSKFTWRIDSTIDSIDSRSQNAGINGINGESMQDGQVVDHVARLRLVGDNERTADLCPIHSTPLEGLACPTCLAEVAKGQAHV